MDRCFYLCLVLPIFTWSMVGSTSNCIARWPGGGFKPLKNMLVQSIRDHHRSAACHHPMSIAGRALPTLNPKLLGPAYSAVRDQHLAGGYPPRRPPARSGKGDAVEPPPGPTCSSFFVGKMVIHFSWTLTRHGPGIYMFLSKRIHGVSVHWGMASLYFNPHFW